LNVLLIQLKRIGDLILTVPAVTAVRTQFPDAKISLVVAHGSRELLPAIEGVDQTFVARGRISDAIPWFGIAKGQFEYCLDFSRTDRSAFLTLLSGARTRITYDTVRREPLRQLSYNQFVSSNVRLVHTVDHHLALLAPLGIRDAAREIRLVLPQAAKERAAAVTNAHDLGDDFVILHPGSARSEKFWMASRWAEVANQEGIRFVVTGGKSRMEQDHIAQIKSHLMRPIVDLSGPTRLAHPRRAHCASAITCDDRFCADASRGSTRDLAGRSLRPHQPFSLAPAQPLRCCLARWKRGATGSFCPTAEALRDEGNLDETGD
jgi:ADP-heptose:LPS heptosyltransferase